MSHVVRHSVIEAAEEVYEDDALDELSSCLRKQSDDSPYSHTSIPSILDSYKQAKVIKQLSSMPSYQATLLLTEYHLMMGETGPLPLHLRHHLAAQALPHSAFYKQFKAFDNETKNLKNFKKCIALQRVNKIMADKPWAINKCHIEQLRLVNLSLSEIVHGLLIMAHFHSLAGLEAAFEKYEKLNRKGKKIGRKENSKAFTENLTESDDDVEFIDENNLIVDRLSGVSCERYWDDCGFSVLNYLYEDASFSIDYRFASIRELRKGNKNTSRFLQAVWRYSQQLLGFCLDDYESELIDEILDTNQKKCIYLACIKPGGRMESSLSLLTLVTVQEARLQAEIVYALHAVMHYMHC